MGQIEQIVKTGQWNNEWIYQIWHLNISIPGWHDNKELYKNKFKKWMCKNYFSKIYKKTKDMAYKKQGSKSKFINWKGSCWKAALRYKSGVVLKAF